MSKNDFQINKIHEINKRFWYVRNDFHINKERLET